MSNRTGKPGAIPAAELRPGQRFRYDTVDAVAATSVHECNRAANSDGVVEVRLFSDPCMITWIKGDTFVFPVEGT